MSCNLFDKFPLKYYYQDCRTRPYIYSFIHKSRILSFIIFFSFSKKILKFWKILPYNRIRVKQFFFILRLQYIKKPFYRESIVVLACQTILMAVVHSLLVNAVVALPVLPLLHSVLEYEAQLCCEVAEFLIFSISSWKTICSGTKQSFRDSKEWWETGIMISYASLLRREVPQN